MNLNITPARQRVLVYLCRQTMPVRIARRYRSTTDALVVAGLVRITRQDMFINDPAPLGFPMQESLWSITDEGREILARCPEASQ